MEDMIIFKKEITKTEKLDRQAMIVFGPGSLGKLFCGAIL
jgi:hypothetical protein